MSLLKFDTYFRKLINNKIWGIPGTKETFYIQAKDGGLGLVSLRDKYDICKIVNMEQLLSGDSSKMMERYLGEVEETEE
jgi:hypothetical protein